MLFLCNEPPATAGGSLHLKGGNMKRFKRWVLTFLLIVSTMAPMTVYAEGEGNIDNGGGGLGQGTNTNYWNKGDEGVRATVVSASDGSAVTASIDLTNRSPSDIKVHFGKVCKSDYRGGAGLSAKVGGYDYYVPAQSLPKIITTSSGSASIAAIKSYFTDEQVIRSIAGYVGMDYDTLTGGDYKLLLEPIGCPPAFPWWSAQAVCDKIRHCGHTGLADHRY